MREGLYGTVLNDSPIYTSSVKLTINGQAKDSAATTLASLVESLDMKSDRVAIELNREIVPRAQWAETKLTEGDSLEIVHFVGGGAR
jgi:thiamine biosynthesis protein ThiS